MLGSARAAADAVAGSGRPERDRVDARAYPASRWRRGLRQPLFAWLSADYFADLLAWPTACQDHTRGILLFQSLNQPARHHDRRDARVGVHRSYMDPERLDQLGRPAARRRFRRRYRRLVRRAVGLNGVGLNGVG